MERLTWLHNYQELLEWLRQERVPAVGNSDQQVVEMPTKSPPLEGSMFVRWEKKLPFVQVIHPMIADVPPARFAAVDTALSRINHVAPLPGFALDPDKRFVYFRQTLQLDGEGKLAIEILDRMLRAVVNNARDFLLAIRGVALDGADPEQVLAAAVADSKRRAAPAASAT